MATLNSITPKAVQVIRVFLGSPSDLGTERRAAREAVDEINRTIARPAGYQIDLVGWEDTLSSIGRPQDVINEDLDTCQVFIGLIWQRWGTPPVLDGKYSSGFQEEYLRSRDRFLKDGVPFIRLFFKNIDGSKLDDAGPELKKVLDFKKSIIDEKSILFQTFETSSMFAQHVRVGLADYIHRLKNDDAADDNPASGNLIISGAAEHEVAPPIGTLGESEFFEQIAERILSESDNRIDHVSVARLRNLALALGGASNDQLSLGPHDANFLYHAN